MEKKNSKTGIASFVVLLVVIVGSVLVLTELWTNVARGITETNNRTSIYQVVATPADSTSQPKENKPSQERPPTDNGPLFTPAPTIDIEHLNVIDE